MFIEQPPWFFRALYPQAIFRMDPNERAVYLTFDDGPIPEVTPWVLELLEKHNIKATFFMVGDNIKKHPDEYRMVVEHGHRIGNHTGRYVVQSDIIIPLTHLGDQSLQHVPQQEFSRVRRNRTGMDDIQLVAQLVLPDDLIDIVDTAGQIIGDTLVR